jgi:hypothetical protein
MAKSSAPFTNFTAGELSPRLDGRTDLAKYFNGCKKLQNFLTFPQGGVTRRPGTEHIAVGINSGANELRLIPFEFNVEQTYVLEFSEEKFRIFKDGGIVVAGSPSAPVEVATPYLSSELAELKFTQSADIMYIVHPNHAPRQITRTDHDSWTITEIDFRRGPFLDPVLDDSTLQADGRTGTVTVTASSTAVFSSLDTGRLIKLHHGYAKIITLVYTLSYDNKSGSGSFSGNCHLVSDSTQNFNVIADTGSVLTIEQPAFGAIGDGVAFQNQAGTITADTNVSGIKVFTASTKASCTVQENDDLEEELEPSFTATTISFHEGDPDATGLAHNDFIEDSSGHFIDEGFKVGMRISATGSSDIDISTWHISGGSSKVEAVTATPHRLIDGDLVTFTGVSDGSLTITFSDGSAADINQDTFEVKIDPDADPETRFQLLDPKTGAGLGCSGSASGGDLVNGNNFSSALIVAVTDSIITLATSNDVHFQNEGASITISGDLDADDEYQLGAFSNTTGYPACVAFFEQRLVFANTATQPQTLFFSVSGDYTNFTAGTKDDSALIYTIGSNQVNVIRYLTSSRVLLVGTSGGEFAVRAGSVDAPITPLNTQIKQQAKYGSADIQPLVIGSTALFVQREQRKIRELVYNFDVDSYVAPDMTLLAEHITEGKIKEMAYQQEPNNVVWCVLENGKLAAMTYRREEDVVAWHEHLLGGTFTDGATTYDYGFVESIASISSSDRTEEEVYVAVRRTINGANVRHIERLKPIDFGTNAEDAFYVDAGLTYDGGATASISGLSHLEGETVSILANGATHADKTVSSGSITLDRSVTKAHVGLAYDSILQTMRTDAGGVEGTAQAKNKRISDIDIRVLNSVGAKIGPSESNLDTIPFRTVHMAMGNPVPLYTGDKFIEFAGGYDNDGFVVVKQDQPLPLTILSIYPRLQTFDR